MRRDLIGTGLGFLALVLCGELGGAFVSAIGLPVPGPVAGLLVLLAGLALYGGIPPALRRAAELLLGHLNLFFVPAAVGVMAYVSLVWRDLWPIGAALFVSTFLSMLAGAWAFRWTERRLAGSRNGEPDGE